MRSNLLSRCLLVIACALAITARGQCVEFYDGLCPGPSSCKCTLNESCGSRRPIEEVRSASGGCSGSCITIDVADCHGDALCLKPTGACGAQPPAPTPAPAYPSNFSRQWQCPNYCIGKLPADYLPSDRNLNAVPVTATLSDLVPAVQNISNAAVILVKRLPDGTPRFKYFGNGHENFPVETWSCSKIFSAMNGAGHMGIVCGVRNGLDQSTTGLYGLTPLGDLVTLMVTDDAEYPAYSGNSLGGWFEVLGGRHRAVKLIQGWMNRSAESLGGNYGATPPSDLNFTDFQPSGCSVVPDTSQTDISNTLSALTMAELVKRVVMARELPAEVFPNTSWSDSEVLLYGAADSMLFPGLKWGGMSANTPNYLLLGINATEADQRSHGQYRTFSKNGGGYSYIRNAMEVTYNGYACYPSAVDPEEGVEYFISIRVSIPGEFSAELEQLAFKRTHEAMRGINAAIYGGILV